MMLSFDSYPIRNFSKIEIENIKNYRFQAANTPILYKLFLIDFYQYVAKFIPKWIKPNQITLFGLLCIVSSTVLTLKYNKNLLKSSRSLCLINFVLLFAYFSADFVDGIHARATGLCSTLGCILDHGVDSISCFSIIISTMSSLGLGFNPSILSFILINILFGFYSVGLGIKYTGKHYYQFISGESEGLFLIMILHLVSAFRPELIETIKAKIIKICIPEIIFPLSVEVNYI